MFLKFSHPADYFTLAIVVWIGVFAMVNLLPQALFFEYNEFHAADVCRDGMQELTGVRTSTFDVKSYGVDQLWSYDREKYIHRIEWSGTYKQGVTESSWKELITEEPGEYRWDATLLVVQLPLWIKVNIKGVQTNDFEIKPCDQ